MFTIGFRRFRNWITLTPLRAASASLIALALVAAAGFGIHQWVSARHTQKHAEAYRLHHCGAGILRRGPQCIGVTDGSFNFAGRQLASVERAIRRQNNLIDGQHHATIALLLPLTDPDPATRAEILHSVQGAYAAQVWANSNASNGAKPKIRLVLANPGVNSVYWRPVVRQLDGMTGAPDNLRVVFGISVSTEQTEAEVGQLTSKDHIPVVTGAPTANDFQNTLTGKPRFPGMARVSSSDLEEARALTVFAKASPEDSILVADNRGYGDTRDDYVSSLSSSYTKVTSGQSYSFSSPQNESDAGWVTNVLGGYVSDICGTTAKWIYFAGRQVQLRIFLNALAGKCGRELTVITGDAGAHVLSDKSLWRTDFTTGRITLDYPAISAPDGSSAGGSSAALNSLKRLLGSGEIGPLGPLTDGETIINYDAALTGIYGIRQAAGPLSKMPTLIHVAQKWPRLTVPGASGAICLENNGSPYDKAIDIMQIPSRNPSGFVHLSWPEGKAPGPGCNPPRGG